MQGFYLKESLEKELKTIFGDVPIIRLKDLVKKIAIVSHVRVGKEENRVDTPYEHIFISDIDRYGIIHPPKKVREYAPASPTLLKSQALQKGDLIISHRGASLDVGLFDGSYTDKIYIGNNSMIRIQFDDNRKETTPLFVKTYLQLHLVHRYLNSLASERMSQRNINRKILSSEELLDLPIPYFEEGDEPQKLQELYFRRIELCGNLYTLYQKIHHLSNSCSILKNDTLVTHIKSNSLLMEKTKENDLALIKKLEDMNIDLDEVKSLLSAIQKKIDKELIN